MEGFAGNVSLTLRRKPTIIDVGETRDEETISAYQAAQSLGHSVTTSTRQGDSGAVMRRILAHIERRAG